MSYELRHSQIIDLFGEAKMASYLGFPKTTIFSWRKAGIIPAKHHPAVLDAAKRAGISLRPADFIGKAVAPKCPNGSGDAHV